jgi:hypothetical protein
VDKIKVIFLDHDGVICLPNQWGRRTESSEDINLFFDKFDKKSVDILNEIIHKTDCEIVVSSDWRFKCKIEKMRELYKIRGIIKQPIDYTTINGLEIDNNFRWDSNLEIEQTRYLEIKNYLKLNPNIKNWVAVDDMDLRKNLTDKKSEIIETRYWGLENFVWTNRFNEGIKQCGIKDKIINYLNR